MNKAEFCPGDSPSSGRRHNSQYPLCISELHSKSDDDKGMGRNARRGSGDK